MPVPCVDCGYPLREDAVGCPNCARNIRAERKLARVGAAVLGTVVVIAVLSVVRRRA